MLYLLKALRISINEGFISETAGQLDSSPLGDINSILSSLGTPDLGVNSKLPFTTQTPDISKIHLANILSPEPTPSLSVAASVPSATAIPVPVQSSSLSAAPLAGAPLALPTAVPTPSLSISAAVPPAAAIPAPIEHANIPAPVIPPVPILEGKSQTLSDLQGAVQKEAFVTKQEFIEALDGKNKKDKTKKPQSRRKRIVKKCPPMPDMTLYIRKDQIPCWGCVLK
jgi:hypothetical protein